MQNGKMGGGGGGGGGIERPAKSVKTTAMLTSATGKFTAGSNQCLSSNVNPNLWRSSFFFHFWSVNDLQEGGEKKEKNQQYQLLLG